MNSLVTLLRLLSAAALLPFWLVVDSQLRQRVRFILRANWRDRRERGERREQTGTYGLVEMVGADGTTRRPDSYFVAKVGAVVAMILVAAGLYLLHVLDDSYSFGLHPVQRYKTYNAGEMLTSGLLNDLNAHYTSITTDSMIAASGTVRKTQRGTGK